MISNKTMSRDEIRLLNEDKVLLGRFYITISVAIDIL